ncbi:Putative two-component sensor kinase [Minicystis rosea]|nr:Putative two-component sensor kinase [Minicystis rosea]
MTHNENERSNPPEGNGVADFLGSLGHDLRSPLGVVAQALAEIRADFEVAFSDEQRLLLSLADRGLVRLGRISEMVTLAAALESGSFSLQRSAIDFSHVARAAVAAASAVEPRREVQVSSVIPDVPCPLDADGPRLQRAVTEVVHNAIRNARKAVRVTFERTPSEACVIVEDDGFGVPDDRKATLFRRLAPRATRSGLGLGLSIAHDVFVAHGGRIALEASSLPPGRPGTTGARFVLALMAPSG